MPQHVLVYEFLSAGALIAGLSAHEQAHLLAQGTAMRHAMLADLRALPGLRVACVVGTTDSSAGNASRPEVAGVEPLVARPGEPHALLLQRAAQDGALVWAVAPETGGALEALARAVPARQWLGCTPDAIALATSKRATCRHLAAHGITVPEAPPDAPGPWVVKPDDGAGAADTRRHASFAAAEADARQRGPSAAGCTLELWVEGEALSLSLCCSDGNANLLSINRQQIEVDAQGQVHFLGVQAAAIAPGSERGRQLAALANQVAHALPGLRGFVGIDLVWHAQRGPVVIEVNPRLTTAYVGLSERLGFNVAQALLASQDGARP